MKKPDGVKNSGSEKTVVVLGGGLTGLSSACALTDAGLDVTVYECDSVVGGLCRTIEKKGFRFDLGGHRFFTHDREIECFVRELMGNELLTVQRSSKIYMRDKYFNYPLKPLNAMFGLGIPTTVKILSDYFRESAKRLFIKKENKSLEDWVISRFGKTMFALYFKEYSEKVWGIDCSNICATWVAQRIKGLSLARAVKNALFKFSGRDLPTLTDSFLYPALGIGRLADRLKERIERKNNVYTGRWVVAVEHDHSRAVSVIVEHEGRRQRIAADEIISSIPLTALVRMLRPAPPGHILETAARLRFRDLVIVAVMVDRPRITDLTWLYIPEKKIPFGRIHEPTNWSTAMAPAGKSLLVMEFFSFRNDAVWRMPDSELADLTVDKLVRLGFITPQEVLDHSVVRVPNAYPLFEVGYLDNAGRLYDYLTRFGNLHIAGRSGMFQYYNMDVALRSGLETAEKIIAKAGTIAAFDAEELVLANL